MTTCKQCETPLLNKRSKYCSVACSSKAKIKPDVIKKCLHCNSDFIVSSKEERKKFCNRSCSAKYNNVGVTRHGQPSVKCRACDGRVEARCKSGYCSIQCRQLHEMELYSRGELDGNGKYTLTSYARRYIFLRANSKCEECGYNSTRKNGSSILQVDHIDGNWQNNRPDNLRLLCPNCHCLTDTWGAGNMGNGRTWKKKYNQYGKQDNT